MLHIMKRSKKHKNGFLSEIWKVALYTGSISKELAGRKKHKRNSNQPHLMGYLSVNRDACTTTALIAQILKHRSQHRSSTQDCPKHPNRVSFRCSLARHTSRFPTTGTNIARPHTNQITTRPARPWRISQVVRRIANEQNGRDFRDQFIVVVFEVFRVGIRVDAKRAEGTYFS